MTAGRGHLSALGLIAPLLLFLGVFFLWPLIGIFSTAVSDPAVGKVFPTFAQAAAAWDGVSPPSPEMQAALVADLRAVEDRQVLGDAIRRLNSAKSGFRSLFGKTMDAVGAGDAPVDLVALDRRWADPAYWRVIVADLSPYTDQFMLAALDLGRDEQGHLGPLPAGQAIHVAVLLRTLMLSALVTALCAAVGLPYAMLAASATGVRRQLLLAAVMIPMWTSVLVRTTAWFIVLQDNGVLNEVLTLTRIVGAPLHLLFNRPGVVIAMTHIMLPFMVLSIFSVLTSLPRGLMPAAASLGAPPLKAFYHVLLPLSLRGVGAGSLLVFMTSIGFYILPALLGGARDQIISSMVAFYSISAANWSMASALSVILLVVTIGIHVIYRRLSARHEIMA